MTRGRPQQPGRRAALRAAGASLALLGAGARAAPAAAAAQAPALERRSFVTSDGVRLSLIDTGPPPGGARADAPTVVLVPGWCMPATIWGAQLRTLGVRWRTLAIDPRGQGESDIPASGYTADRRADDLDELLAGRERVVLVGWSLGALEALQYVYRHGSDRLLGLALVDSSVGEPPEPPPTSFKAQLRRARAATVNDFVRAIFARPRDEAELTSLRDEALRMPLESSIALLSYPQPREHWREVTVAFRRPLAYFVTPHLQEQARNLLADRPATRVEVFEHAGHALFVDEPDRFNGLLAEWIEQIDR